MTAGSARGRRGRRDVSALFSGARYASCCFYPVVFRSLGKRKLEGGKMDNLFHRSVGVTVGAWFGFEGGG